MEVLYVYEAGSLADAAETVGDALGLPLGLHDSSYYGGGYLMLARGVDQVSVLENYMEDDDEPLLPTQQVAAICVQVIGFADAHGRARTPRRRARPMRR